MCELPNKMASLQITEDDGTNEPDSHYVCPGETATVVLDSPRRILRKRITNTSATNVKRRCKLPPKKFTLHSKDKGLTSLDELATLYTSKGAFGTKSIKCLLETIYEEPVKLRNGSFLSVGIKKVKRTITFSDLGYVSKTKQRKRKAKAKLLSKWSPKRTGEKRVSLDNLISKLEIEESGQSSDSPQCTSAF